MEESHPIPDLDDNGRPFNEDEYFRRLGIGTHDERSEPPDPYKKIRDEHRKKNPFINPMDTMLELRPASEWVTRGRRHRARSTELFGSLWREGEVAVLFAESGAGKSILAVQIAEAIARGVSRRVGSPGVSSPHVSKGSSDHSHFSFFNSHLPSQKVLYLDFELTERQFAERYSTPSPIPGKLPVRYRFSRKLIRSEVKFDGHIPEAFKGDLNKFLRHSIDVATETSGARVLILDNISYFAKHVSGNAASLSVIKTLKLWTATNGLSILVLAPAKGRRSSPHARGGVARGRGGGSPITLDDIAAGRSLGDLADSVFAIGRSTFGDDYRYVKHLTSRTQITHDASNVLVYRLDRMESGKWKMENNSENSQLSLLNSQFPPKPFLGLTYLGVSAENDHLRDYEKEARDAKRVSSPHVSKGSAGHLKSSRSTLIDGILDGSYTRYLKR